ncbi:Pachytene checkpoint protein [Nymphaea thermarum]|nr:Pachytene checkpoint protein [Nymphaea thermarum]
MSTPMEISSQNGLEIEPLVQPSSPSPSQERGNQDHPLPTTASSTLSLNDEVHVSVEVCLKPSSVARFEDVRAAVERMLEKRSLSYSDGPIPVPVDDIFLAQNVQRICICDTDEWVESGKVVLFWQAKPLVHVFQRDLVRNLVGRSYFLAFRNGFSLLENLMVYGKGLKQRLLRYAGSALIFTEKRVDPYLVSWNRVVLLHGPPGTGKTSLCKALAQKLSIRLSSRYTQCQLVEVNAHSLFSKWFSESGKLVAKLFQKIQEMVEEENNLVFVLIDEVESLAAARQAALSGSEPSDSIRVVNALLTQLDRLKAWPNVFILTTSNITAAIDIAFVDRADIKAYVGPPTLQARYEILRSCVLELLQTGILLHTEDHGSLEIPNYISLIEKLREVENGACLSKQLLEAANICEGLSGRALRKLPFLAHASLANPYNCTCTKFVLTLIETAKRELSEKNR